LNLALGLNHDLARRRSKSSQSGKNATQSAPEDNSEQRDPLDKLGTVRLRTKNEEIMAYDFPGLAAHNENTDAFPDFKGPARRLAGVFIQSPGKVYDRGELSRASGCSLSNIKNVLTDLRKLGFPLKTFHGDGKYVLPREALLTDKSVKKLRKPS